MTPTVTYTGTEVALVAGCIALALPELGNDDFEVLDLMLERALAALPQPLAADLSDRIERLRHRPFVRMEDTDK